MPPGAARRTPRDIGGPERNSTIASTAASSNSSGHFRRFQVASPPSPIPSQRPMARAIGPLTSSTTALLISSAISSRALARMRGALRHGGRSSFVRCMACSARRNTAR